MKIAVAGAGYVGLITGVVLAYIGHEVICVDVDKNKIEKLQKGCATIYEEQLVDMLKETKNRLFFTTDAKAYSNADVIFVGVGTPERQDGSANLDYVYSVCDEICSFIEKDVVVVIKSTVPIGTNQDVEIYMRSKRPDVSIMVVSNPEFLSQGTAIHDTLYATRIVVGSEDKRASEIMKELYSPLTEEPYHVPYLEMKRASAEMVKYASNDFLALKISYINEIANFCEKVDADIDEVTKGMSYDPRIGSLFLKAGIGYGGSCFPKDTKALHWLSKAYDCELKTIKASIEVNKSQKVRLFEKFKQLYGEDLSGRKVAVLGVSFKPNTDDIRESPAIDNVELLLEYGLSVVVYDPVGLENFRTKFSQRVNYTNSIEDAIKEADAVFIMTEWKEIKEFDYKKYVTLMKKAVVFDGRNCYDKKEMKKANINYICIGK